MPSKKTPARPSRSRAETKAKLEDIQDSRAGIEATDAKTTEAAHARASFIRGAVGGLSVEGVIKAAADLKLAASASLDDVTARLAAKVEELHMADAALALARIELKEVHDLDVAETSIDILLEEHEEKRKTLEAEISELRAQWADEQRQHSEDNRRRDQELQTTRKREADEFEYKKGVERRQKEDDFAQGLLARERSEKERVLNLEKSWTAREAALSAQENDIALLKEQVGGFDERLKKEKDAAVAIATNSLKKELTYEFTLQKKDLETTLQIERAKVVQAEGVVKKQEDVITQLQTRIVELQKQVVDTASKAIDGSAKQDAFNQYMQTQRETNSGLGAAKRPG